MFLEAPGPHAQRFLFSCPKPLLPLSVSLVCTSVVHVRFSFVHSKETKVQEHLWRPQICLYMAVKNKLFPQVVLALSLLCFITYSITSIHVCISVTLPYWGWVWGHRGWEFPPGPGTSCCHSHGSSAAQVHTCTATPGRTWGGASLTHHDCQHTLF